MTPERVRIREVGPRDGFQNEPEIVPTEEKVRLIDLLARTGVQRLEVTSFVRADVIPQLADAEAVLDAVSLSASETHNRNNVNRSIEESLSGLERVLGRAREVGLRWCATSSARRVTRSAVSSS